MATGKCMEHIYPALHRCKFFEGIPKEKYPNVLNCLQASLKAYQRNQTILQIGEPMKLAGVVISGTVELAFLDENGNLVNVNHIGMGEVFGAAMACLEPRPSPMQLKAVTDCEVLLMNFNALLDMEGPLCPHRMQISTNLLRDFAQHAMFLNQRLRIISQKRLRDKIKLYLQHQSVGQDGKVTIPFNRNEMADYLYVDRSALSRELSRMQQEGIIAYQGQDFYILNRDFLTS